MEIAALSLSTLRTDLLQAIMNSWITNPELQELMHQLDNLKEEVKGYSLINQQLRKNERMVVGSSVMLRKEILQLWHDSVTGGHSGIDHTYRKVAALFYWRGMKEEVENYVKKCDVCQKSKYDHSASPGLLQPLQILALVWSSISMDFIEGLPKYNGKEVIWVVVDRLTKYAYFIAVKHPYSAIDIAKLFMENIFKLH